MTTSQFFSSHFIRLTLAFRFPTKSSLPEAPPQTKSLKDSESNWKPPSGAEEPVAIAPTRPYWGRLGSASLAFALARRVRSIPPRCCSWRSPWLVLPSNPGLDSRLRSCYVFQFAKDHRYY